MDLKQIKQIAGILKSELIEEFEWREGDFYLRMKRNPAGIGTSHQAVPVGASGSMSPEVKQPEPAIEVQKGPSPGNQYITSPIVGTFYRAPSPKADPYIKEGDTVRKGQVLCIIEAMKLMNELEAEYPCEIVKILAGNAQPVEFGEPLIEVRPL